MEQEKKPILPHLGILVTTYCNLNCRRCADLIPKRRAGHYSPQEVRADMLRLLAEVAYIEEVLVIGGEVFMYPWLEEILDFCGGQEKIGRLIITTNGSIQPSSRMMACIKRNNVRIRVSGYPQSVTPGRDEMIRNCLAADMTVENFANQQWADIGPEHKRNRSAEELRQVFGTCSMKDCVCMQSEGKIFYCARSMSAYETDIYPTPPEAEYVDVRNEENLAERLREFYALESISTCDYCDGISCATKRSVPAGTQILDKKVFLELLGIVSGWLDDGRTDAHMMHVLKELLVGQVEYLLDMPEYQWCIEALQEAFISDTDEKRRIFMERLRKLVNVLTDDYEYSVDENLPYARTGERKTGRNQITAGWINGQGTEDLLIGEEELFEEIARVYPIDGITYNRLFIESRLEKLKRGQTECAVCGLSYTQYGVIEREMAVNTVNLSVTGQDIPYSILMAEKALELAPGVKTIVMPIAWYQGFYDISADDAQLHQAVMAGVNIPILKEKRNYNGICADGCIKREGSLKIYDKICDLDGLREYRDGVRRTWMADREYFNEAFAMPVYGGLQFDFRELSEEARRESAKITAELNERIVTESGYREVRSCLEDFLPDMRARGVRVVFFVPPMTKYLYEAYSESLKRDFAERIVPIFEPYENVRLLDLSCSDCFCDEDFLDYEHLNEKGAVKLTALLSDEVKEGRKHG